MAVGSGSCSVTERTPASTTFFAISTPRPRTPTMSTSHDVILCIASLPRT